MPVSQLSQIGVGTRRSGSFAGKRMPAPITRLAQFGVGTRRYGGFDGKEPGIVLPPEGVKKGTRSRVAADRYRQRMERIRREDEEIMEVIRVFLDNIYR